MFKYIIVILLSSCCYADPAVVVGGWSHHIDDQKYRSHHEMVAFMNDHYAFGRFTNSFNRPTTFAVYRWTENVNNLEAAINIGFVYGYRSCLGDEGNKAVVCPAIVPQVTYTRYSLQPTVLILGNAVVAAIKYQW